MTMYTTLKKTLGIAMLLCSITLMAQDKYVLVTSPSKVQDVCGRHGLSQLSQLTSGNSGMSGTYLVSAGSVDPAIATDPMSRALSLITIWVYPSFQALHRVLSAVFRLSA